LVGFFRQFELNDKVDQMKIRKAQARRVKVAFAEA